MYQATANGPSPTAPGIAAVRTLKLSCLTVCGTSRPDQNRMTERMTLPSCSRSNARLISSSGSTSLTIWSILISPPDATGDELERAGMYLLARARDADDRRLPPPLVAALERGAHDVHVAYAF